MPRKSAQSNEESENELIPLPNTQQNQGEVEDLADASSCIGIFV